MPHERTHHEQPRPLPFPIPPRRPPAPRRRGPGRRGVVRRLADGRRGLRPQHLGAGRPGDDRIELLAYVGLVVAGVVLAVWLGTRARAGAPDRLARYALGMAIGSAATFVVFWTGWPRVLGAVAIALALEHRRRIGGFTGLSASAAALGILTTISSINVSVVG